MLWLLIYSFISSYCFNGQRENMARRPRQGNGQRAQSTRIVCFEVLEQAPNHDLSADPEKEARRLRRGDVISTRLTPPVATRIEGEWRLNSSIGTPKLVYIHVEQVPEKRWQNLRKQMQEKCHLTEGDESTPKTRTRKWRVRIKDLPDGPRTKLIAQRECTMQWNIFRSRLCKKVVHDPYDPASDNDTPIEDTDIPEDV